MANDAKCPRCAEPVKSDAKVCKHCAHEFTTEELAQRKVGPSKLRQGAVGCLAVLALLIVIIVVFAPKSEELGNNSAAVATETPRPPALKVTARELAAAYDANEVAAQKRYGGETLEVTGIVTGVDLDLFDSPVLKFQGVNQFLDAQATFTKEYGDKLGALSKGDKVTITCKKLTEVMSAPMLDDCTI